MVAGCSRVRTVSRQFARLGDHIQKVQYHSEQSTIIFWTSDTGLLRPSLSHQQQFRSSIPISSIGPCSIVFHRNLLNSCPSGICTKPFQQILRIASCIFRANSQSAGGLGPSLGVATQLRQLGYTHMPLWSVCELSSSLLLSQPLSSSGSGSAVRKPRLPRLPSHTSGPPLLTAVELVLLDSRSTILFRPVSLLSLRQSLLLERNGQRRRKKSDFSA